MDNLEDIQEQIVLIDNTYESLKLMNKVGTHIGKDKNYLTTLTNFFENHEYFIPVQIFSGPTKSWKRPAINPDDIKATSEYIKENNIQLFIHSIYLINFGRPSHEITNAIECLAYDLELGSKINCKGVVIHCGKSLKLDIKEATDNMYNNMIDMLDYTSENCPIILETPAGQGSELCYKFEDFSDFYDKFTEDEKKKIKICVDTCHIWASGYNPSEYITNFLVKHSDSIILCHFNDSKNPRASKLDRHEHVGLGKIGIEEMLKVYNICIENNIPMLIE